MNREDMDVIASKLAAPFSGDQLDVRPGSKMGGTTALMLWYVDARAVAQRLTDVLTLGGWNFYVTPQNLASGAVVAHGRLHICFDMVAPPEADEYGYPAVTREDVGEADKEDEPYKSAVSDALKRCAVQFGVGAFLYSMPSFWWPLNSTGKAFAFTDELAKFKAKVSEDLDAVGGDPRLLDVDALTALIPQSAPSTAAAPRAAAATAAKVAPKARAAAPAAGAEDPITAGQLKYLLGDGQRSGLLDDLENAEEYLMNAAGVTDAHDLTKKQAIAIITELKG